MRLPALLLLGLAACVPARRKVEGSIVRDLSFEGNGGAFSGQNDYQLRAKMQQKETRFGLLVWPFAYTVHPRALREAQLEKDAWRLEIWYAHHGWFDARVEGWDLSTVREGTEHLAAVVDVRGRIETGERSVVRALTVEGLGRNYEALERSVLRTAPIREGDAFDLDYAEATRQQLEDALRQQAHPYARVTMRVDAHPTEHVVDVALLVDEGIVGAVGPIEVSGNDKVDTRFIDTKAALTEGDPYHLDALREAQRRLFEMGTFSIVTVDPDLTDPTRTAVPIRIKLTESKFRTLRLGVGFDYDSYIPVLRATGRIQHVDLFRQLIRAELGVKAGFAWSFDQADLAGRIPTYGVDLTLEYPRLFDQKGSIELRGEFEQDIYGGLWSYQRPEADLSFVYRFNDDVQLRLGPHVEQYTFLGEFGPRVQEAQQRLFGIESDQEFQYQLTAMDEFVTWDWRDDPIHTTRGSYYSVSFREAVPLSSSGYGFVRGTAEARRYVPVRIPTPGSAFPVTLVGRIGGTVIEPYGSTVFVPLPERAFLGGASSVRGFRSNQVGPYTALCTYEDVTTNGFLGLGDPTTTTRLTEYYLPNGGDYSAQAGVEGRYDMAYGLTFALFGDAGMLASTLQDVGADALRASGGFGFRYDTKVGPIRFDLSFRPLYPEDDGPVHYTQCDAVDQQPRVNDFFANFGNWRDPANHPPIAMVFFLTIGEAF